MRIALALAWVLPGMPATLAADGDSWWDAARRADDQLETADVTTLAGSLAGAPASRDAAELLFRFEVFVRAGHDEDALATLDALAAADPPLPSFAAGEAVDSLIDRGSR